MGFRGALLMGPVVVGWLTACGPQLPDPIVSAVVPDRGWNGESTIVAIAGDNFYPQVQVAAGGGPSDLDARFTAWLVDPLNPANEHRLNTVSVVSFQELEGVVSEGLPVGVYDLRVEGPTGRAGFLEDAFTVADSRAEALVLGPDTPSTTVNTTILVNIRLVDPNGATVDDAGFEIAAWLQDGAGNVHNEAEFAVQTLLGGTVTEGGVQGTLLPGGSDIRVTTSVPGVYTLVVAPADTQSSVVEGFSTLQWTVGAQRSLDITLPSPTFEAQAGVPFDVDVRWVDQFGNLVTEYQTALLESDCSGFLEEVPVTDPTTVSVTLTAACEADVLSNARDGEGGTPPFEVIPGEADHFSVVALPNPSVAGEELNAQVVARDVYDNATDWSGTITLAASTGGLVPGPCAADQFNVGEYDCTTTPTVASGAVVLSALGDDGINGDSSSLVVVASETVAGVEVFGPSAATAGSPFSLSVRVHDTWDNTIHAGRWGAGDWSFSDEENEVDCAYVGVDVVGYAEFDCTLFTTRDFGVIQGTLDPELVTGDSQPIDVGNGPLTAVSFVVAGPDPFDPWTVEAGTPFTLVMNGSDAWGNPAVSLANPVLDLADATGTLTPLTATLDASASETVQATLTKAGATTLQAWQDGVLLGTSDTVVVEAGTTTSFRVTILNAPWAWVGQAQDVRVESEDVYGNRSDWSGSATLSSTRTSTPAQTVTITNGVGTEAYTWTSPALDEQLEADAQPQAWTGLSDAIDVVTDCGASGPVADMSFGGLGHALACTDPVTDLGVFSVSYAGSIQGTAAFTRYSLDIDGGSMTRSASDTFNADLPGVGVHALRGLVVDTAGCGDEVAAWGYAGPDDDEPVGPLALTAGSTTLVAGVDTTTLTVDGVTDCAGDIAANKQVLLRTALGELTGVVATGQGLAVTLDALGEGTVTLDAQPVGTGGEATLTAWVPSGAASGGGLVNVTGDDVRPHVSSQSPEGEELGMISQVVLGFSEPMRSQSLVSGNFSVTGPNPSPLFDVLPDPDLMGATLALTSPIDASAGSWTVTILDSVRDDAGNKLSGDWSGLASTYTGVFGDVGAGVDAVVCTSVLPSSGVFRPDGDDGILEDSDAVELTLDTAAAPAWWEVTVTDDLTSAVVVLERQIPVGTTDTWVWEGRDQAGRIVDNGGYTIEVTPVDGAGNRGVACSASVTVDNYGVVP